MRLQLKVDEFSIVSAAKGKKIKLELLAGMEDVFGMLDEVSPKVLADYMTHRMRDCFEQKALNNAKRHRDWVERKVGGQW